MAPFQYEAPQDKYSGTIADITMRQGDISAAGARARAELLLRSGDIAAREAAVHGAAVGGAATDMANIAASVPRAVALQQEATSRGMDLAEKQRYQGARQALAGAMGAEANGPLQPGEAPAANPYLKKEGDVSVWDVEGLSKALSAQGYGDLAPEVVSHISALNTAHREEASARAALAEHQQNVLAKSAGAGLAVLRAHPETDPAAVIEMLTSQLEANGTYPPDQIAAAKAALLADPENIPAKLEYLSRGGTAAPMKLGEKESLVNPNDPGGAPLVAARGTTPKTRAELAADAADPKSPTAAQSQAALDKLAPPDPIKPGTVEDWVRQSRAIATTKKGAPLTPTEQIANDAKAVTAFKELSKDPQSQAILQSNNELRNLLLRAQLSQQPTAEDAKTVAQQLINKQMAPSQLALFGGFGGGGAAFKRMVGAEAIKLDPSFNWEEAESNYQVSKSPGFQSTVRFMDSALESMPRMLANAQKLGNGNWRTWNQLANAAAGLFNDTDLKRLKTDATLVGDEVAKILSGGGTGSTTSDAKLKQGMDIFNTSDSVPAIAAAMDEVQNLLGFRRKAMTRGTYLERTPTASSAPAAKPGYIRVKGPNGETGQVPQGTALGAGWSAE